jgi:hypothetical protein
LTQASWFRPEDKEAVKAAAKELKFSVIELQTEAVGRSPPARMRVSSRAAGG